MWRELFCVVVLAAILYAPSTGLAGPSYLGSAQDFAVLGASTVTNTGSTTIYGSVGVDPGSAITGFPPGTVTGGSIYGSGGVSNLAQSDALTAYNALAGLAATTDLTGQELGGLTLTPGVYSFGTTAGLNGALTLDFAGNPGGEFVFQIGTALTTGSGSSVNVINGSQLSGVYWLMGVTGGSGTGSATLGTTTMFAGNILALDSITLNNGADILCGRAIALNAAVTMDNNRVSNNNSLEDFGSGRSDFGSYGFSGGNGAQVIPAPGAFLLVAVGMATLSAFRKRTSILK
jgi:type VI secretion system secreted protein VgrG